MKIKKITIENFRSYYGTTIINIGEGLNLLIGSNGDGKTTFFDALYWLFESTEQHSDLTRLISKKKTAEMLDGDSAMLRVNIEFEHNNKESLFEKCFTFSKSYSGNIETTPIKSVLYEVRGSERVMLAEGANRFNKYIFDQNIRKYCLFKGESKLNVFEGSHALKNLIETFSDIRTFDPYIEFCEYAHEKAQVATNRAMSTNRQIESKLRILNSEIQKLTNNLAEIRRELKINRQDASDSSAYLDNLERNKESAAHLNELTIKINNIRQNIDVQNRRLKEEYSIRLLDEYWILMGMAPILDEFSKKVAKYEKNKRKLDLEHIAESAVKNYNTQLLNGAVPLAPYIPDEKTMREMLDDHVCKVCGTLAPEGSEQYKFMEQRLNEFLASQKKTEKIESLFSNAYIDELNRRNIIINNERGGFIDAMRQAVVDDIEFNQRIKSEISKLFTELEKWEEHKKQLLADVPGLSEEQLLNEYNNINNWWNKKNDALLKIKDLERQESDCQQNLAEKQREYDNMAEQSPAAIYNLSQIALRKIKEAFIWAKNSNRKEFLLGLEKEANIYLDLLNKNDFRGVIRLREMPDGQVKTLLVDNNDVTITNPNTALSTTMYMSILFAVSKLTTIKRNDDYPLIFDAPTSSFTDEKESDFFRIIGDINKQVIIVTKSFLRHDEATGTSTLDTSKLEGVNATVYRMELKKPFDRNDVSTIQTTLTKIK